MGTVRVACTKWSGDRRATGQDDVRCQRDQFGHVLANVVGICRPAELDLRVAAVDPARLLEGLQKCSVTGLRFSVVRSQAH